MLHLLAPYIGMVMVDTSLHVSNAKAKIELGWQPLFQNYHDGIAAMLSDSNEDAEVLRLLSHGGLGGSHRRIAG
jgi:hypothetical protein